MTEQQKLDRLDLVTAVAHQWRDKMSATPVNQADQEAFTDWLNADVSHQEAYDRAITVWAAFDTLEHDSFSRDLSRPTVSEKLMELVARANSMLSGVPAPAQVLALLTFIVMIPLVSSTFTERGVSIGDSLIASETYSTKTAETREVYLADGTLATLGPKTTLETRFTGSTRSVVLMSGAALFNVRKDTDRPFSVSASDMTATALGTVFDVRSSAGVVRVGVAEGKVRVTYPFVIDGRFQPTKAGVTLLVGEQVAAKPDRGLRSKSKMAPELVGAWADQELVYDGVTLAELISDVNRYTEDQLVLSIDDPAVVALSVTASFRVDDIERLLELITMSFPVELDRSVRGTVRVVKSAASKR